MRNIILLIDESAERREMLRNILNMHYTVLEASSLEQTDALLEQNQRRLAAVLIDIALLQREGQTELLEIPRLSTLNHVPKIVVTQLYTPEMDNLAYDWGADLTLHRPFHPSLVEKTVHNMVNLYSHKWNLENIVEEQKKALIYSNDIMIDTLSTIIEYRSAESGQHVLRIRYFTRVLLEAMAETCPEYNLDEHTIQFISSASAMHDIGKISIPDTILNKPGKLTAEEYEIMKTHSAAGSEILAHLGGMGNEEYLRYAYNICRYHHERWDGNGYPDGLAGDAIPLCAQVTGLADVFDALTTKRVYKDAYSCAEAASMILAGECGQFSPKLLECFKMAQNTLFMLADQYRDGERLNLENIAEPLVFSGKTSGSAMQNVMAKYESLLHHLNAMVLEFDLDRNVLHTLYNPNPDLHYLKSATNMNQVMQMMAARSVHPDDQHMMTDEFQSYVETFLASGLRKSTRRYRILGADQVYRAYNVTIYRLAAEDNSRKIMGIWQVADTEGEATPSLTAPAESHVASLDTLQYCRYDRWLTMEKITEEFSDMIGYTAHEIAECFDNRLINCIHPEYRERVWQAISHQLTHGNTVVIEMPLMMKKGELLWLQAKGVLFTAANGLEYIYGRMTDITPLKVTEAGSPLALEHYRNMVANSGDVLISWNAREGKLSFSSGWQKKFGYTMEEIPSESLSGTLFHPDDYDKMQKLYQQLERGKNFGELPVRLVNAEGKYIWQLLRLSAVRDSAGTLCRAVGTLISVREEWDLLTPSADSTGKDSLTMLLNKDAARRKISAYLAGQTGNSTSAMIILDLDNFKALNDKFGHLFGDTVLTSVAVELNTQFRSSDILARIGGDEFLIFLPNVSGSEPIITRCNRLIDRLRNLFDGRLKESGFSCSAGIVLTPEHGVEYQELFQKADKALYHSKRMGKGAASIYEPILSSPIYMSQINQRIDSDEEPQWNRNSLAHFAFEMLYESSNIEDTISTLLSIVGKQASVSRVYIFENNADNTACSNTFEWCNEGISAQKDELQNLSYANDIPGYMEAFNEKGVFYCSDVGQLAEHLQVILEPQGVKSLLQCSIRDSGQIKGFVGFDDNHSTRLWTKDQVELLTFLSQIISVFLLKKRLNDVAQGYQTDLTAIMEQYYDGIYVIDPANHHNVCYMNIRAREMFPEMQVGQSCYAAFGRTEPCPDCPVAHPDRKRTRNDPLRKRTLTASANKIHWMGRPEWLIASKVSPAHPEGEQKTQ